MVLATLVLVPRRNAGRPALLADRCPHRGAQLSLGRVRDGALQCPYHGWRWEIDGQLTFALDPEDFPEGDPCGKLKLEPIRCEVFAGFIWVVATKIWPPLLNAIEERQKKIADGLSRLLADTYSLYLKTHYFHWNVTGPMFNTLHLMFETQYNELWNAVDPVAERIRALGYPAPGSYSEFAKLSSMCAC